MKHKDENNAEQLRLLQEINDRITKLEDASKKIQAESLALLKDIKEFLVLGDCSAECISQVQALQERLFKLR